MFQFYINYLSTHPFPVPKVVLQPELEIAAVNINVYNRSTKCINVFLFTIYEVPECRRESFSWLRELTLTFALRAAASGQNIRYIQ